MKIKSKTQRTLLAALMVLATSAIGLQSFAFESGARCSCETSNSVVASCRESSEVQMQGSCCSPKHENTNPCRCNPVALSCECSDCGCSDDNESHAPIPAIPSNETSEVVTPTSICSAPFFGFPRASEIKQSAFPKSVLDHATLSSQQTCVLLSRFTC